MCLSSCFILNYLLNKWLRKKLYLNSNCSRFENELQYSQVKLWSRNISNNIISNSANICNYDETPRGMVAVFTPIAEHFIHTAKTSCTLHTVLGSGSIGWSVFLRWCHLLQTLNQYTKCQKASGRGCFPRARKGKRKQGSKQGRKERRKEGGRTSFYLCLVNNYKTTVSNPSNFSLYSFSSLWHSVDWLKTQLLFQKKKRKYTKSKVFWAILKLHIIFSHIGKHFIFNQQRHYWWSLCPFFWLQ